MISRKMAGDAIKCRGSSVLSVARKRMSAVHFSHPGVPFAPPKLPLVTSLSLLDLSPTNLATLLDRQWRPPWSTPRPTPTKTRSTSHPEYSFSSCVGRPVLPRMRKVPNPSDTVHRSNVRSLSFPLRTTCREKTLDHLGVSTNAL